MNDEAELRMAAYNLGQLRIAYAQVVQERDDAIAEVAALRQTLQSYEARNRKPQTRISSRGFGPPLDGVSRPVSGGSSGSYRG